MPCALLGLALIAALASPPARQDNPTLLPHKQDVPPGPALSPEEAIRKMVVPEGFRVELVAAEPDLVNPVAMTFDEKGRIWVTESLEYPRLSPGPGRDRVKVLEDTDDDGRADRFTVFADGLNIPSGIAVGHGGVWVANSPDLLFYPDADRDGKADGPPEVVVTGFGRADTHELPNSLTWGPDGWLYGWNGVFNPSKIAYRGKTFEFTCAIFRVHPKTRDFQVFCEGTSNPWGIAINEDGDFFASACVIDHLWHLVEGAYYIRQGGPYPPHTWPMGSIVKHKHQKAAYCGIHYFDSAAFPEKYRRKLYMGNIHGNGINVDRPEPNGSTYVSHEEPDFLAANDAWFMPVSQKTGPDGSLYILDWYDRYHCYQDANRDPAGIDRLKGRLYRVRYGETPRRVGFDFGKESDATLLAKLASDNVYERDIAQRLLGERIADGRQAKSTSAALEALALDPKSPRPARMHAIWTLVGARSVSSNFLDRLLEHDDPAYRAWGVRVVGDLKAGDRTFAEPIVELIDDPAPAVRLQLAIALPKLGLSVTSTAKALLRLLQTAGDDPLLPHLVWQRLRTKLDEPAFVAAAAKILRDNLLEQSPALDATWPRIVERIATTPKIDSGLVAEIAFSGTTRLKNVAAQAAILDAISRVVREGRVDARRRLALAESLTPMIAKLRDQPGSAVVPQARKLAGALGQAHVLPELAAILESEDAGTNERLDVLEILVANDPPNLPETVVKLLANRRLDADTRSKVLAALGRSENPAIASAVLAAYDRLEPGVRPKVIDLLVQREPWSLALVEAVEAKSIPASAITTNHLRRLQGHKPLELKSRVRAIWGALREGRNAQREMVVLQMRQFVGMTPGDPITGRAAFDRVCAQCHKLHGEGQEVGPDLTSNGRNDLDQLVSNVFDPSLVIGEGYRTTSVATTDGRVLSGLLAEYSPERIVLKTAGGKLETIPRNEVEESKTSDLSLMPEDLEKQLQPQEIADLFALLGLDKPPTDPSAKRLPGLPGSKRADSHRP